MLPWWISRLLHNHIKPCTLLLPAWKPVLDFMHFMLTHKHAHRRSHALTHANARTYSSPHAAWNGNKALPYCCQGNVVGSDQSSGLSCSWLSPSSTHSHYLSFCFSSPLSLISVVTSLPAHRVPGHLFVMVTVTFFPEAGHDKQGRFTSVTTLSNYGLRGGRASLKFGVNSQ